MAYKSGFFSLIGCPNVGKSTLINALVGQKISIVTDRAQTTRNRITGVLTRDEYQMIFLDTPGMTTPKNTLGEYMQKTAGDCLSDVEAILFLVDARKGIGERDKEIMARLKLSKCPVLVLLNKCDIATKLQIDEAEEILRSEGFSEIQHISAFKGTGLAELEARLETIDKSNIFRALQLFREAHLVHVLEDTGDGARYELCHSHGSMDDDLHVHFYCEKCHKTFCLEDIPVPAVGAPDGFIVHSSSHLLRGICPDCSQHLSSQP